MIVRHWTIEEMFYEVLTFGGVSNRITCGKRITCNGMSGAWLVHGHITVGECDTFEMNERCVDIHEFIERTTRMKGYALSIYPPVKMERPSMEEKFHIKTARRDGSPLWLRMEGWLFEFVGSKERATDLTSVEACLTLHVLRLEQPGSVLKVEAA